MTTIRIIKSDITKVKADAIVNAANEHLAAGGGVCGAIFEAAGYTELENACRKISHCDTGSAVATPSFKLGSKCIIHAVGPKWTGGDHGEPKLLRSTYLRALTLAAHHHCTSIVFPLISAGIFGYPEESAWEEAMAGCKAFDEICPEYSMDIIFAVRSDEKLETGTRILNQKAVMLSAEALSVNTGMLVVGDEHKEGIFFHRPEEPGGFLSNWFPSYFREGNLKFSSAEQYIMYRKCMMFGDLLSAKRVLATDDVRKQKEIGRNAIGYIPGIWEGARQAVAMQGLKAKFTQNEKLKKLLLQTGDAWLVECAETDKIWACGQRLDDHRCTVAKYWTGKNLLGFALMEVRDMIRTGKAG